MALKVDPSLIGDHLYHKDEETPFQRRAMQRPIRRQRKTQRGKRFW
jgi:hypothetical protein